MLEPVKFFPQKENRVELLSLRHNRKFIRHFLLWSKVASKAKKRSLKLRPKPRKEKKQGWKKTNLESQVSLMKTKEGAADKGQIKSE